jgi:hypothetical protein
MFKIPLLPSEILHHVFSFAALSPDSIELFDTHPTTPRPFVPQRDKHRSIKTATLTARSLVRVCKLWNALASPYLYRTILISRGRTLYLLHRTLFDSRAKAEASPNVRPLGCLTRSLEVAMKDHCGKNDEDFDVLADIISCMPHLTAVTFSIRAQQFRRWPMSRKVLSALATTCGPSLEVLRWSIPTLFPFRRDLRALLNETPNLCVLCCYFSLTCIGPVYHTDIPVLPRLASLALIAGNSAEFFEDLRNVDRFPSLRELVYYNYGNVVDWNGPLEVYGASLTEIYLHLEYEDVENQRLVTDVSLIAQYCPNLVRLNLAVERWSQLVKITLSSILILGLRCRDLQSTRIEYSRLITFLKIMEAPVLRAVQFLDLRNVRDLRLRHADILANLVSSLSNRGVQVQDQNGIVLVDGGDHFLSLIDCDVS